MSKKKKTCFRVVCIILAALMIVSVIASIIM